MRDSVGKFKIKLQNNSFYDIQNDCKLIISSSFPNGISMKPMQIKQFIKSGACVEIPIEV